MTTNRYVAGTMIQISTVITAVAGGEPIDPTTLTLTLKLPDGSDDDLTSAVVKDSVGNYHADYTPTTSPAILGLYQYEWLASGVAFVGSVGSFFVDQGPL